MTQPGKPPSSPMRYLLARYIDQTQWRVVVNPNWGAGTQSTEQKAWAILLENSFNSYVEYENSGVVYRIVRDISDYNLAEEGE